MRDFIKNRLRENLISEEVKSVLIDDIEDDKLYDEALVGVSQLTKDGEISFGQAEPFGVLLDDNEVVGATWVKVDGQFSWHIQITPEYRGQGYSKLLIDDLFTKYQQMKSYRGDDYQMVVNVVNPDLVKTLEKYYNLSIIQKDGPSVIMSN